ncbi:tRNA lysidine(34) synthetase TilS [Spirosoma pollinicola]|uniref:tRNA(Ile)-lysidine synthase n=1 Tax=Spirosoma pollinicola TaxID=2057025 RepID=A0A2K8YVJ1_9BACT|nr:tRNA lysidine(34) synthetase TilS [Spirosoma pollinicola]AUD01594.1 tRNA lysidine(34) synthetase TilS [Spirosoma pollinicola]
MVGNDFLGFINDNRLFETTDRVLLAVSGGLDSVAMAELFQQANQPFAIAHVNFSLRAEESDADAIFVENMAKGYGVPFHLIRFDTATVARERGVSIQMAARELRYTWFDQLLQDYSYACVATAHHQNDLLETLLLNLTRGTGLAGLHGISARQNQLVRPLLFATRDQLAAYIDEHNLQYREDSSNSNDKYARNRIRHHVVPVLNDLNPGLWQTLPRTVERLRAAETLMRTELDRSWHAVAEPMGDTVLLPTAKLVALPEVAFRLMEWLKPMGFSPEQARQLASLLSQPAGQIIQSTTHRVVHERAGLLLEPLPIQRDFNLRFIEWPSNPVDVKGYFELIIDFFDKPVDFRPANSLNSACLDADRLTLPLTIRPWRQGDKLHPLGLNGHKLVSDLLNDLKLSRTEREQTVVLLSGNEIAWVIGRRIDHRFRVTAQTKHIVRFECR